MIRNASEENSAFLSKCWRYKDKVFCCEWCKHYSMTSSKVFVSLICCPSPTINLTSIFFTIPSQSNLFLPFVMFTIFNSFLLQIINNISHVRQEAYDCFHHNSMNHWHFHVRLWFLIVVKRFTNLIDPELKSEEETSEWFLLKNSHGFFFVCFRNEINVKIGTKHICCKFLFVFWKLNFSRVLVWLKLSTCWQFVNALLWLTSTFKVLLKLF